MAGGIRGGMGIASLILIAGSIVLLFFVVLSGLKNTTPLNKTYFLKADTSTIAGSGRAVSQWTYFYVCGEGNTDCGSPVPALPIGYAWVGGSAGAPDSLVGGHAKGTTSKYYFWMWKFGWVFYLMALILDVFGFFTSLLAPCSRLASGLSGLIMAFALFWMTLAAALMTATFVKARNAFQSSGIDASLGKYAFGFTWGAWFAMFLATLFLFLGCGLGGRKDKTTTTTRTSRATGNTGFFRRQRRASRSHGSISESQRRVKDEYA